MKREKFGIKGFDTMMQGGVPHNSIIGLSGPPGVGKSLFTLHYLVAGAEKGQKCLYINLEEPRSNIDNMLAEFKFADKFRKYEKKGLIVVKCMTYPEYERVYIDLFQRINEDTKIQRLAIDSFNVFFVSAINPEALELSREINIRRMINQTFSFLRRKDLTTLLVLEKHSDQENVFQYNIPYLVDGIIKLDFLELGTIERRIFIPKMRWTNQYKESKAYDIGKMGIRIRQDAE